MNKIIEAAELPLEEKVYLKKDWFGWRVVHPVKNEDGSWNWFNLIFGSKSNLAYLMLLLLFVITIYFGMHQIISQYQMIADNPCNYCWKETLNLTKFNATIVNFTWT